MEIKKGVLNVNMINVQILLHGFIKRNQNPKVLQKKYIAFIMYDKKENEAVVNEENLKYNCPKCSTPHFLYVDMIQHSH